MDKLPNSLVIGAQKRGTTSLYYYLRQHPQIYMSPLKEPHFFTCEGGPPRTRTRHAKIVSDLAEYKALFAGSRDEIALGEASPSYLYSDRAPERIHHYIPEAKLIAILRNPTERAFSNYLHALNKAVETLRDFESAVGAEDRRVEAGWGYMFHYKRKGFYGQQLTRYLQYFDRSHLRVYLYEDLRTDPQGTLQDIYTFLGVRDDFAARLEEHNVSGGVPKGRMGRFLNLLRRQPLVVTVAKKLVPYSLRAGLRQELLAKPELSAEMRSTLIEEYRDDILRLQELIGHDLSPWLR